MQDKQVDQQNITVTFTIKQLSVIRDALEAFQRGNCGQFSIMFEELFPNKYWSIDYYKARELNDILKAAFFPTLGQDQYLSIAGIETPEEAKIAYDISKTIRQFLALKRTGGVKGYSTDFDGCREISKEPCPKITEV